MRAEVDDPERGQVVMPGVPVNLTGTPGRVRGPAPALGQHEGTVAPRAPKAAPDGPPPVSEGPLSGYPRPGHGHVRGRPVRRRLLAELGADVIKVEPLGGDPFRVTGFVFNRGMRSLSVNLGAPDGVDAFRRLAAASDVVVESLRPGVTAKLGIDYDDARARPPGLITVSLSAYGEGGPLAGRPGVDMVLQGMSGMMSAQGGDSEPVANTIAIIDVTTAAMLALSTVLALLHRERGRDQGPDGGAGLGQRAWASLVGTATFLQTGEIVRYEGRPHAVAGGRDYLGADPFDRYYQASDGWVRLQAPDPAQVSAAIACRGRPAGRCRGVPRRSGHGARGGAGRPDRAGGRGPAERRAHRGGPGAAGLRRGPRPAAHRCRSSARTPSTGAARATAAT